jgi:hypothetical protein
MSSDEEDIDSIDDEDEEVAAKPKRRRKKKGKKDPNKPKRNMSAFFLYSNANRERVKEENPEAKFGDIVSVSIYQRRCTCRISFFGIDFLSCRRALLLLSSLGRLRPVGLPPGRATARERAVER